MDKKLEEKLKKQEKEITDLKKMVQVLSQQNKKLNAGYNRNADNIRALQSEIIGLKSMLRRIT